MDKRNVGGVKFRNNADTIRKNHGHVRKTKRISGEEESFFAKKVSLYLTMF